MLKTWFYSRISYTSSRLKKYKYTTTTFIFCYISLYYLYFYFEMTMMVSLLRTNSLRSTCWPSFLAVFSTDETICIAVLLGMLVRSRAEVISRLAIGSLGSSTVMKSDLLSLFSWMLNSSFWQHKGTLVFPLLCV